MQNNWVSNQMMNQEIVLNTGTSAIATGSVPQREPWHRWQVLNLRLAARSPWY